jgi:hypothetical protein
MKDREVSGRPPRPLGRAAIAVAWLVATAIAIALMLIGAEAAKAGIYRAAQCNPSLGAGHSDIAFERTSDHYRGEAFCGDGGTGLTIAHRGENTHGGRRGAWRLEVPAALELIAARMSVAGTAESGHLPELAAGTGRIPTRSFGRAAGHLHRARWKGPAGVLEARLRCARGAGCGRGRDAELRLHHLLVTVRDATPPQLDLGGSLLDGATHRGRVPLEAGVADAGSGVSRVVVDVNGEPIAAPSLACDLSHGIGRRLQPCPAADRLSLTARTAAGAFRQGPNLLRACAFDYSRSTDANRDCAGHRVRIDNQCPVSGEGATARVEVRARPVGGRGRVRIEGRLTRAGGGVVAGATVCVATRIRLPGTAERVVATPRTGPGGRFRASLPRGPSRELRVAYWADRDRVAERYIRLRSRVLPRLRLRPRGTLHNGDSIRFEVRIPGPVAAGRRVALKVRDDGHWLVLRAGRTDGHGRWSASYRFHDTAGERRYRFRAYVPRQAGYPYRAGRSPVRRARVVG